MYNSYLWKEIRICDLQSTNVSYIMSSWNLVYIFWHANHSCHSYKCFINMSSTTNDVINRNEPCHIDQMFVWSSPHNNHKIDNTSFHVFCHNLSYTVTKKLFSVNLVVPVANTQWLCSRRSIYKISKIDFLDHVIAGLFSKYCCSFNSNNSNGTHHASHQ